MNMLECFLIFCLLLSTVDAQITISADKYLPRDGDTVNLICSIPSFIVPATWSVNNNGVGLTVCRPSGPCQPANDAARYIYTATASSISVTITSFNSVQDTFGWRCQYDALSAVYVIKPAGDHAVGVIQGDVFMSWKINTTDISLGRAVFNPDSSTVIYFPRNDVIGIVSSLFNNRVIDVGNVSLGMVSFRLLNLTVADAGRYYYRSVVGSDAGGQVLVIAGIPANISVLEVVDAIENEKYTIQCSALSTSVLPGMGLTMHYQWKRENGQNITANDRYSFSSDQSNLIINPLKRQDAGTFVCVAWEHVGAVSQSGPFTLKVIYGPDPESIHLSPNRTSHELTESFTLSVNCSTDCFPDCQYRWTGPGVISPSNTGLLSIISIRRNQTGQYACTASNPKLPDKIATIIMTVVVLYPPVLAMKATNTSKGGTVVINCTASGVPDNYTFYKLTHMAPDVSRTRVREIETTRVSGSEVSYTIEEATYQDTGFYVCRASNGITHYSTGQLIMEAMVSVWIADQPIITSNVRYFDAEKGKTGYIHIEFYSGVIQPAVTWYLVKNGTMELLQNSSGFGIYLSAVTLELQYYQKTVQLPGYSASLEVFYVHEEQFTSYKVEIENSFAEPVFRTLELKSRGPPETPINLSVVPDSVTTHSLQLSWRAGFHGGASQTFVIEYREVGKTNWLNKSEPRGLVLYVNLNLTITDLKDGTKYELRIYSENVYNRSQVSLTINETTKTAVPSISEILQLPVAGIAGGISAGLVVIFIMGIGIFLWRRGQHKKQNEHDNDLSMEHEERQSQMKRSSVKKDEASGKEYEGLHFKETEANQYLQLNGITSEENRNTNIRSPVSDSYEQLHSYANNDIQLYSSLTIPKTSKDAEQKYENTWIKKPDTTAAV